MSAPKVITDNNKSPLVQVLTLMFLVTAILACLVRTVTKFHMIKALRVDDVLVVAATLFAIGQSIAVLVGCGNGLGKHVDTLSSSNVDNFFKSQYAANALFIASLVCSKLSGTMTLRIMSQKSQRWIIIGGEIVVGLWGLTALFVNLFQCQLPSPWSYADTAQCINQKIFWSIYSIVNIITDIAIVIIMGENVLKIQTSWSKKILVMGVFGSRILVTPAIAVQIYYSNMAFASVDFSFSFWQAAIAIQLVQCLAIVTVCIPNLKPFLDSLESGQIRVDDLRRQGKSSTGYPTNRGYAGYKSGQSSGMGSRSRSRPFESVDGPSTTASQLSNVHEMVVFPKSRSKPQGQANVAGEEQGPAWDGQSRASQTSETILIQQSWRVDVERMHERGLGQN